MGPGVEIVALEWIYGHTLQVDFKCDSEEGGFAGRLFIDGADLFRTLGNAAQLKNAQQFNARRDRARKSSDS